MEVDNPMTVSNSISHKATVLPEIEVLCYLLVLVFLIDQKQYKEVIFSLATRHICSSELS
jgi:26S proteasome regulatory subunit N3